MIELPPLFVLVVIAAVIFVLVTTASQHRRNAWRNAQRLCRTCGANHPPFARFCRRCGKEL
jgi:ribosomal protein L40E